MTVFHEFTEKIILSYPECYSKNIEYYKQKTLSRALSIGTFWLLDYGKIENKIKVKV